jgi:hypothetical protein
VKDVEGGEEGKGGGGGRMWEYKGNSPPPQKTNKKTNKQQQQQLMNFPSKFFQRSLSSPIPTSPPRYTELANFPSKTIIPALDNEEVLMHTLSLKDAYAHAPK